MCSRRARILCAASLGSSCSQIRSTDHPAASSIASVLRSRSRFASSLAPQNSAFFFGRVPCSGHACQKHPSTKTASFPRGKTRSAVRRMAGIGRVDTLKRRPIRCTAERTRSSVDVSRLLVPSIVRREFKDDAQDPTGLTQSSFLIAVGQGRSEDYDSASVVISARCSNQHP